MLPAGSEAPGTGAPRWDRPGEPGGIGHPGTDTLGRLLPSLREPGERRGISTSGWGDGGGTSTEVLPWCCQHPLQPELGLGTGSVPCPPLPTSDGDTKG